MLVAVDSSLYNERFVSLQCSFFSFRNVERFAANSDDRTLSSGKREHSLVAEIARRAAIKNLCAYHSADW